MECNYFIVILFVVLELKKQQLMNTEQVCDKFMLCFGLCIMFSGSCVRLFWFPPLLNSHGNH